MQIESKRRAAGHWSLLLLAGVLALFDGCAAPATRERVRQTANFDDGWRFLKADAAGAEQPAFDDSAWRRLNVPHDWSIEGPFAETNLTEGAGAFLPSGIGWYRKHFSLPPEFSGRRTFLEFDGVMANSDVWVNGVHLGHRPYGYVSFGYEATGQVNLGGDNVVAVRADTLEQPASRWYTGAGIYRHVRLVQTSPLHIEQWGTFVSTPAVSPAQATVHAQVAVTNEFEAPHEVFLKINLLDPNGKVVGAAETPPQTVTNFSSARFEQDIVVKNPRRWELANPVLYRALVKVCATMGTDSSPTVKSAARAGFVTLDDDEVAFGIREFKFDANTGFWLNGKNFKIKGVCLHHDGGAFGAAVPLAVWERRLNILKQFGVNAVRTAHNPPAPEFLDLCDRLGVLVMDEFFDCWTVGKNEFDYHLYFTNWSKIDARDTIRRDRNHPSVILYSVGNEIHDTPKAKLAYDILQGLVEVCHENDPTRPATQALFRPNVSGDYTNGLADLLDVIGTNYRDRELLAAHRDQPARKIIGTEQGHTLSTWLACRDNPEHAGQFLWTGIDYLGEARSWPRIGFGSGLLDRTATPRPGAFQRQSWWSGQPMVYAVRRIGRDELDPTDPGYESADLRRPQVLFCDWTPRKDDPHEENVEVYSNCETVELWLNGKSLGTVPQNADDSPRNWYVPFAPGTLKVIGRNHGRVVARQELRTAGKPAKIILAADRKKLSSAWDDVACISATIVDANNVLVPTAGELITFKIEGPGVVAAVDNGNNSSSAPFQSNARNAYQGRCVAMIKAGAPSGKITVSASSPGLENASVVLKAVNPSQAR